MKSGLRRDYAPPFVVREPDPFLFWKGLTFAVLGGIMFQMFVWLLIALG